MAWTIPSGLYLAGLLLALDVLTTSGAAAGTSVLAVIRILSGLHLLDTKVVVPVPSELDASGRRYQISRSRQHTCSK